MSTLRIAQCVRGTNADAKAHDVLISLGPSRHPTIDEQLGQDLLRRELSLGNGTRGLAVALIVCVDRFEGGRGLLRSLEGEQSTTGGIVLPPPGVLNDDGLAEREVDGTAAAEPAGAQRDVDVLGHAPL